MITFNFSFSYPDDKIADFAEFLGYVPSEGTHIDFVKRKATDHINLFTTQYANARKLIDMQKKTEEVAKTYEDGVIASIKNALVSTVETQ